MTRRVVAAGWLNRQPGDPGMAVYPRTRHQPDPNPTDPRLPGDPWDDGRGPELVATDGDGAIGGRGHCRRMALLLLPLLPLLFVVGLLLARPKPDGHHLGSRHKTAPPEGEWTYDREANLTDRQQGGRVRGLKTNLDPGEKP